MKGRFNLFVVLTCALTISLALIQWGCSTTAKSGIYETYYRTGSLKRIEPYQNGKLDGIVREYYEIGSLKHAIEYEKGKLNGIYNTYYPDGAIWKKAVYKQGRYLSQWEYDEEGFVVSTDSTGVEPE